MSNKEKEKKAQVVKESDLAVQSGGQPEVDNDDSSLQDKMEEDEDLLAMAKSLKSMRSRIRKEFTEAKKHKDMDAVLYLSDSGLIWLKNLNKAAQKELRESGYDKWRDLSKEIGDLVEEIRDTREKAKKKLMKPKK